MSELILFGRELAALPVASPLPDWQQADPRWMGRALHIIIKGIMVKLIGIRL